jgi:hypothetical protein
MLYKFQCKKAADVLMLQDLAQRIFEILDKPLEAKGVFLVEQLPQAIARLEAAIAQDEALRKAATQDPEQAQQIKKIDRLGQRAFPFMQLLKEALSKNEMIIWGV